MHKARTYTLHDRLYGELRFSDQEWRLFQTPELTRLRHIAVAGIAAGVHASTCCSRFEHSVGVAHLARIVGRHKDFTDVARNLFFAGLIHDLATPPFSHASEDAMREIVGRDHEDELRETLSSSSIGVEIQRQGGCLGMIKALLTPGADPLSDVVAGSLDLDNLDNSLRYGVSMGLLSVDRLPYRPESLAQAFRRQGEHVVLGESALPELRRWAWCRQRVYDFVNSYTQQAPAAMLRRALHFAALAGKLEPSFFRFTDSEAIGYLLSHGNERTVTLIDDLMHWRTFDQVVALELAAPPTVLADEVADHLARVLGLDLELIAVSVGDNKGHRVVKLPIVGIGKRNDQPVISAFTEPSWYLQVFLHPRVCRTPAFLRERVEEIVQQSAPLVAVAG